MKDGKQKQADDASSSTVSKGQRSEELIELPSDERESRPPLLPFSDSLESGANSGSSASFTSVTGNNYHVFLNFRGSDTRKGFVDHLYHRLVQVGLHHSDSMFGDDEVFRDDEKLHYGEPLSEQLLSAIEPSKISIPVISENYATSQWCLHELIKIMECKKRKGQKVYPVLYKVTTGDVSRMEGKFGEAFQRCKHKFDKEVEEKGQEALKNVVVDKIFESEKMYSGYEGKLVNALVETILQERQRDFPPSLSKDLIGIDDHVASVMHLMDIRTMKSANTASYKTQIIMIYGIGGIGKTTLATTIYKKLSENLKCRSFCKDIRERIKSKGIKHVQSQLISDITYGSDRGVGDFGIATIRSSCENKKVVLLDDVDCRDYLDNLIGDCNFYLGSWIIITCRDKTLLKPEYKGYELKQMNDNDSLLLFSKYAGEQPSIELANHYKDIVLTTGALPLALVIIGSFLKDKDESMWIETLKKLRKVPLMDVQKTLRISYDSLEYEEQQMFLDIACFFIGIDKKIVTYLWEDLQYCLESGLKRMIELSLVKIDDKMS